MSTPAGWYPTPNGGQRYWDGHRWLALPEPEDAEPYDHATAALMRSAHEQSTAYNRKTIVIAALAAAVLVTTVAGGLFWKNQHDTQMRNNAAAASSSSAVAAAEQQAATARAARAAVVIDIEAAVMTMAKKHASDGVIDGPIISASCVPVDGGSTDDLTEKTTVFECFVAEKDNGDGTMSGMKYHATQNWTTGEYTYGLGAPR